MAVSCAVTLKLSLWPYMLELETLTLSTRAFGACLYIGH